MKYIPFKTISTKTIADNPYIGLEEHTVEIPNGAQKQWYIMNSCDGSITLGFTPEGHLLLVRVYRYPHNEPVIGLPAGGIKPDQTPEEAARAEFEEESGYTSAHFEYINKSYTNTGSATTTHYYYTAKDCTKMETPPAGDEDEQIEVFTVGDLQATIQFLKNTNEKVEETVWAAIANYIAHVPQALS